MIILAHGLESGDGGGGGGAVGRRGTGGGCVSSTYCLTGGTFSRPQFSLSQLCCRGGFFEGDCGEKTSGQPQVKSSMLNETRLVGAYSLTNGVPEPELKT